MCARCPDCHCDRADEPRTLCTCGEPGPVTAQGPCGIHGDLYGNLPDCGQD